MSFSVNLGLLAVPKVKTQFKRISKRFQPKEEVLSKLENIFRHKSVPVITEGQKSFRSLQFNIRTTNKKISKVRFRSWNKVYKYTLRRSCILPSTSHYPGQLILQHCLRQSLVYTYWADLEIYIPAPGCV